MQYDDYGQCYITSDELVSLLYKNPELKLSNFTVDSADAHLFNTSVWSLFADMDLLKSYKQYNINVSVEEFDSIQQDSWHMPREYLELDIAKWVLSQCKESHELQRAGQELMLYQDRNLFNLLRYLKYLVDTLRYNNVLWGVGRGSSVSSYVLYLIGVHRIDSLYYDLSIDDFLK
jgi:DNA polymerase III alpha subunit